MTLELELLVNAWDNYKKNVITAGPRRSDMGGLTIKEECMEESATGASAPKPASAALSEKQEEDVCPK